MLSTHKLFNHLVDVHRLINELEVNQSIDNVFYLFFIFESADHFIFQQLNKIFFFIWRAFLDNSVLAHLLLGLFVINSTRFLACFREATST